MKQLFNKASIILAYFFSSTLTTIINKYILNILQYPKHYLLIVFQSILIVMIILVYNFISTSKINFKNYKHWYIPAILLSIMLFSNNKSIYYFPVTVFSLYKNVSIILIAILELKLFNKKISVLGYLSFLLMILSSYPGNFNDSVSLIGYSWILLNILSTAGYMVYLKFLMNLENSSRIESVFFCNLFSLPILYIFSILFDKLNTTYNSTLIFLILISSISSFLTAFSTVWTLKIFSSTTLSMLGALSKLLLSTISFLIFSEQFNNLKIISLIIGIISGIFYSFSTIPKKSIDT